MYGKVSPLISRHALHALSLEFVHPKTNELMLVSAMPSEDITSVITEIFGENILSNIIEL